MVRKGALLGAFEVECYFAHPITRTMKYRLFLGLLLAGLSLGFASAQAYKTALGLRISPYYGATFKHFVGGERAIEAILMTRRGGFGLTGLYEIHTPAFGVDKLYAYGGIGAHVNVFRRRYRYIWDWDDDRDAEVRVSQERLLSAGIDLILGLEYTIDKLPFTFSLDWKPALNLIGDYGLSADQFALSVRFVF